MSAVLILSWAVGTVVGIFLAERFSQSTVAGSLIGGIMGTLSCYLLLEAFVLRSRMLAELSVSGIMMFVGFSMCGSAVFAALVGIVRGGITTPWRRSE